MISVLSVMLAGWLVWVISRVLRETRKPVKEGDRIIVHLGNQELAVEWFVRRFVNWVKKNGTGIELLINVDAQDDTRRIIEIFCRNSGYVLPVRVAGVNSFEGAGGTDAAPGRREYDVRGLSNKDLIGFSFERLVSYA